MRDVVAPLSLSRPIGRYARPLAVAILALGGASTSGDASAAPQRGSAGKHPSAHAAAKRTNATSDKGAEKRADKRAEKAWCAPEVSELDDHVCTFDGGPTADGRRTLVVYLHGAYAATPGFAHLQQRAMALHAKRLHFTVLLPTSPRTAGGYVWPTSQAAQKEQEAAILEGLRRGRAKLEKRAGRPFDETFVVGFSSGAYYGSSLAVRGALDVDGYVVLAGGSSWVRSPAEASRRAPVFVGVSAADAQTRDHSRAFAGSLASMQWPRRVEERNVGHMVDWGFLDRGLAWLRAQASAKVVTTTARDPAL